MLRWHISPRDCADWFGKHRRLLAALVLLLMGLAIAGYVFDRSVPGGWVRERKVGEYDSDADLLEEVNEDFDLQRVDCFMVVDSDDLLTPANVAAVRRAAAAVERLVQVETVFWLDNVPTMNVFGLADPLLPPDDASPERFAAARRRVLQHPLVAGQLLSPDGNTLLLIVTFDWLHAHDDAQVSTEILETARDAAAEVTGADVRLRLTGDVPLYLAQRDAYDENRLKFQLIGYALVAIVAVLLFRGLAAVSIVGAAAGMGIFWGYGILLLVGHEINPLTSAILPVLLAMVGVSDGVHLMVHIRRTRAAGASPLEASQSAIEHVGVPCFLTSLTTAVGFGSLMLAESQFVRSFGSACAIGVIGTFIAVVVIIPLLSSTRLGHNIHRGHEHDIIGRGVRRMTWLVDWTIRRRWLVTGAGIVITFVFAGVALSLRPDSRLSLTLPDRSAAYQTLADCDREFGGIEFARVVVTWPDSLDDDAPEILAAVIDVEQRLADEPTLANPLSIRGVLQSFPGDSQRLDQRMSYLELMPQRLKEVFINDEARRALITVRIQDLGMAKYQPVFQRVQTDLDELQRRHPGFRFELTGDAVVRGRRLYQVVVDLARSLGAAAVIILIIMAIVYRSLRIGLIAIIPNTFPLAATAFLLVVTGDSLSISGVCAFTVCLGIAVDDTIHFLSRYRLEAQSGDHTEAIRRAFVGVGTALVITTLVMTAGFASVLLSDLPTQRIFAAMACVTIVAALIGDLIFLPAMLACFGKSPRARTRQPPTPESYFRPST